MLVGCGNIIGINGLWYVLLGVPLGGLLLGGGHLSLRSVGEFNIYISL